MPTTPPQVRAPITGPRPQLTDRGGHDVAVRAGELVGERDQRAARRLLRVAVRAQPTRPIFQPMIRRASFSTMSCEVCPPRLPRTSTISAVAAHLGAQVAVQVRPALPHHVGHVQVADPAVGPRRGRTGGARPPSPGSAAGGRRTAARRPPGGSRIAPGPRQRRAAPWPSSGRRRPGACRSCLSRSRRASRRRPSDFGLLGVGSASSPSAPPRASAFGGTRDQGRVGRADRQLDRLAVGAGQRRPRAVHRVHRAAVDREDLVALAARRRRARRTASGRAGRTTRLAAPASTSQRPSGARGPRRRRAAPRAAPRRPSCAR